MITARRALVWAQLFPMKSHLAHRIKPSCYRLADSNKAVLVYYSC